MTTVVPQNLLTGVDGPLAIVGHADALPGRLEELREVLLSFVPSTRAEPGAVTYQVHEHPEQESRLVFYEHWRSEADLAAHLARPELQAFLARRGDLVDGDLVVQVLRPVEPPLP